MVSVEAISCVLSGFSVGDFGLVLDALGAIIVVLPELPYLGNLLTATDEINQLQEARQKLYEDIPTPDSDSTLTEDDSGFKQVSNIIEERTGLAPEKIEIGRGDTGLATSVTLHYSDEIDTISSWNIQEPTVLDSWIRSEINQQRDELQGKYLYLGVFLLFVGFSLQIINRIGILA